MTSTQKRLSTIRSNESKAWSCEGCGWSFVRLTVGETRSEAGGESVFCCTQMRALPSKREARPRNHNEDWARPFPTYWRYIAI